MCSYNHICIGPQYEMPGIGISDTTSNEKREHSIDRTCIFPLSQVKNLVHGFRDNESTMSFSRFTVPSMGYVHHIKNFTLQS